MKLRPVAKSMAQAVAVALSLAVVSGPLAQQGLGVPAVTPAVAVAGSDAAEQPMARLKKADGDVLASTDTGLVAVREGAEFKEGTRVMTMARTTATIRYSDGCEVELKPNMRIEIRKDQECKARQDLATLVVLDPATELALGTALETPTASIPALVLGGALGGPAAAAAGVAGVATIAGNRPGGSVSPS